MHTPQPGRNSSGIRVFVSVHADCVLPREYNSPVYTLVGGGGYRSDRVKVGDDTGDNISRYNKFLNEQTVMYWVAANCAQLPDFVGFAHYRRHISMAHFNPGAGVIACPSVQFPGTVREQYATCLLPDGCAVLSGFIDGLAAVSAKDSTDFVEYLDSAHVFHPSNIFVMPRGVFMRYWDFMRKCISVCVRMVDTYDIANHREPRVLGHILERVSSFWIWRCARSGIAVVDDVPLVEYAITPGHEVSASDLTPCVRYPKMRVFPGQEDGLRDMVNWVGKDGLSVVEVGSFAGESAEIMLSTGKVDRIYCVDPWEPGYDPDDPASAPGAIRAAEAAFDLRFSGDARVTKVRSTLADAMRDGRVPQHVDLVYLDGCLRRECIQGDIEAARGICDVLAGHDWCFASVRDVVTRMYGQPDATFPDNSWVIRSPVRSVCIVIPLYKAILSSQELESFEQCLRVLGGSHDVAIVCGESFAGDTGPSPLPGSVRFERFDDSFFASVEAYSRLCASAEFYSRFMAYTHILLYQLDGYVFRDDLLSRWVRYDYVGAPWCLACPHCTRAWVYDLVGNGGVSLRNVRKCLAVVNAARCSAHPEDVHLFTSRFNPASDMLHKPHCFEALEFSLETNPRRGYAVTGKVPSFCHKVYDSALLADFKRAVDGEARK